MTASTTRVVFCIDRFNIGCALFWPIVNTLLFYQSSPTLAGVMFYEIEVRSISKLASSPNEGKLTKSIPSLFYSSSSRFNLTRSLVASFSYQFGAIFIHTRQLTCCMVTCYHEHYYACTILCNRSQINKIVFKIAYKRLITNFQYVRAQLVGHLYNWF